MLAKVKRHQGQKQVAKYKSKEMGIESLLCAAAILTLLLF